MKRALVPFAEGFEEIEATTVVDVLRRGGVEVVTASITPELAVKGAHGMSVLADCSLASVTDQKFDVIVLPGGGQGTENLKSSAALYTMLDRQAAEGRLLAAICAAPTVLVDAGVIPPEVHVTCYPTCQMLLDRSWAPAPVVSDQGFVTGQAPGSAMLFALVLLQELEGAKTAGKVARELVTDVLG